jgi:hypothetical protein
MERNHRTLRKFAYQAELTTASDPRTRKNSKQFIGGIE